MTLVHSCTITVQNGIDPLVLMFNNYLKMKILGARDIVVTI